MVNADSETTTNTNTNSTAFKIRRNPFTNGMGQMMGSCHDNKDRRDRHPDQDFLERKRSEMIRQRLNMFGNKRIRIDNDQINNHNDNNDNNNNNNNDNLAMVGGNSLPCINPLENVVETQLTRKAKRSNTHELETFTDFKSEAERDTTHTITITFFAQEKTSGIMPIRNDVEISNVSGYILFVNPVLSKGLTQHDEYVSKLIKSSIFLNTVNSNTNTNDHIIQLMKEYLCVDLHVVLTLQNVEMHNDCLFKDSIVFHETLFDLQISDSNISSTNDSCPSLTDEPIEGNKSIFIVSTPTVVLKDQKGKLKKYDDGSVLSLAAKQFDSLYGKWMLNRQWKPTVAETMTNMSPFLCPQSIKFVINGTT
jgi:hypothetical protein